MLRVLTIVCLIAGLARAPAASAQQPASPIEAPLRDRAARSLTISGEHRSRYESLDPQFRPLLGADDQVLAMRTSLTLEAALPRWRIVGEIEDSRAELNDVDSTLTTGVVNTFEPLQVFARRTWIDPFGAGSSSALGIGRMTMDLGSRRLIARNAFRNTRNSFAGVDWMWQSGSGQAFRAFYVVPMRVRPLSRAALLRNDQQVDDTEDGTHLLGLSYERSVSKGGDRLNVYWVALDASRAVGPRDIDTFGARIYRSAVPGRVHYEAELMLQSGRSTGAVGGLPLQDLDHDADFYHLELGYTLGVPMSPSVTVQYDFASGDDDPFDGRNERFDTLYGARSFDFGPSGIYGPFARANLETPGIRISLDPAREWRAELGLRSYRLASARDFWTTTGLRDSSGQSGDSLGRQFAATASWQPGGRRLGFSFGAARFSKGEFVRRTVPERSQTSVYYYLETTISFLGDRLG